MADKIFRVKKSSTIIIEVGGSQNRAAKPASQAKGLIRSRREPDYLPRRRMSGDPGEGGNPTILVPTIEFVDIRRLVQTGSTVNIWYPAGGGGMGGYVSLYRLLQSGRFNVSNSDSGVIRRIVEVRYTTFGETVETIVVDFTLERGVFTGTFAEPFLVDVRSNDLNHHVEEFRVRNVTTLGMSFWTAWQAINYRVGVCEIGSVSPAEPNVYDDATFTYGDTPDGPQTIMNF